MTITRKQIDDLRVGDVVEVWDGAYTVRGPVSKIVEGDYFQLGMLAYTHGERKDWTLTVIERAPRPLYVNHPRAEPTSSDVARINDGTNSHMFYMYGRQGLRWYWGNGTVADTGRYGLTLLVDGGTGQVVL